MKKKKKEIDSKFIFKGNVTINSDNAAEWEEKLKGIQQITGDLYIYSNVTFSADALKSVGGYLSISSNVTFSADALKSVGGDLYIYSNVTLPALKSVGGDLYIYSNVTFSADALKSVGGYLSISSNVTFSADALKSVGGYLYIYSNVTFSADALKSVGGYLYIYSNVTLPALKSVGGYLSISSNVTFSADALKSVGGYLYIYSNVTFSADALKSVGGYLSISSNVTFSADALKSVGGYLYIYSNVTEELEKQLWKHNPKNIWHVTDLASDWLLSREGNIFYSINRVSFEKPLFDAIRKGTLSAAEVFAIENIEQRRVAYEKMNKFKIRELPSYQIIDEVKNDGFGYPMKLISFIAPNIKEAFKFLNCFDPSTGREYFLECFNAKTCAEAKVNSFGLGDSIKFTAEW